MLQKKKPHSQADGQISARLRNHILQRDRWRCQICGSMVNLQVHHPLFRSHGGQDSEDNLITLCAVCHGRVHRLKRHNGIEAP